MSKLSVGLLQFMLSFVSAPIVNRVLGPAGLGVFSFARSAFKEIFSLLGAGTEAAFFNYAVRHKKMYLVILMYSTYIFLIATFMSFFVIIMVWGGWHTKIWPDVHVKYISLGAILALLTWIAGIAGSFADAKAETVLLSRIQRAFSVFYVGAILLMYWTKSLNLFTYFLLMILIPISSTVTLMLLFSRKRENIRKENISRSKIKEIAHYFYEYSHPLFVATFFSFCFAFFDRWFLQIISGSIEQGYFSLGIKISGVVLLFTAAITPIFKRELSKAHASDQTDVIKQLFGKYCFFCFFFVCAVSLFFAFHADILIAILGGRSFEMALLPSALLLLDPLYRTYDQLSGSVFLATERTPAYRNVLFCQILSVPLSYFLIAPETYFIPGLGLGATGLALKAVILAMILTNIQLFVNCRFLKIEFRKVFFHQIAILSFFSILLISLRMIINIQLSSVQLLNDLLIMTVNGCFFFTFIILFAFSYPKVAGMKRSDLTGLFQNVVFIRKR